MSDRKLIILFDNRNPVEQISKSGTVGLLHPSSAIIITILRVRLLALADLPTGIPRFVLKTRYFISRGKLVYVWSRATGQHPREFRVRDHPGTYQYITRPDHDWFGQTLSMKRYNHVTFVRRKGRLKLRRNIFPPKKCFETQCRESNRGPLSNLYLKRITPCL